MASRKKQQKRKRPRTAFKVTANKLFFLMVPVVLIVGFAVLNISAQREVGQQKLAACEAEDLSGLFESQEKVAYFEGRKIDIPESLTALFTKAEGNQVLGVASDERWIEVDLSDQKLIAWEGNKVFLETSISSGLPWSPTPRGEFRIWIKLRATKMEGGQGRNYYYLPNVPYVMFFYNASFAKHLGYGLHGTYWHNDFGRPKSHGCVNLPTNIAEKLYYWAMPVLPTGKSVVHSSETNLGTRIVIHD